MKLANVEEALAQVRKHLFAFMVEEGIYSSENPNMRDYFLCPNPRHKDANPSAHILATSNGTKAFCHGCSRTFDLLTLNHWKHGVPISGAGFITNNLMILANRYKVPFELGDLTEEDRFKIDVYHANRMAADYIVSQEWPKELKEYVENRGLTVEHCRERGIGVVPSYDDFESFMKDKYTTVFLREASFLRPGLFGSHSIIFTIKDSAGSPVGFISRDLKFEDKYKVWDEKGRVGAPPRKYDSTSESNRVYMKRELLYGFSDYLQTRDENLPLQLVEGQFDCESLVFNGLNNVASLGGNALTPYHLSMLRRFKISNIVLVMDGDKGGRLALERLLLGEKNEVGMLATATSFKIGVLELPEGEDPNSYIQKNGIEAYKLLIPIDAFTWALNRQDPAQDPIKTCEIMIPFILTEANVIRREQMIRALAEATGSSVKAIDDEILRREDAQLAELLKERKAIAEEALRELQYGDGDAGQILRIASDRISELEKISVVDPLSIEETISALDDQVDKEAKLDGPSGYRFDKLKNLELALNGDMKGTVIALGGVANTGKSALMSQLGKELVSMNSNSVVILHTIDDNRMQMNRRLAIQFAIDEAKRLGMPIVDKLTLNKMANPKFYLEQYPKENEGLIEMRDFGYNKLREYIKEGRLHIKDMTHGATVVFLEKMIRKAREDHPDADLVAILDNFHKTQDFTNQDERTATKRKSQYLKTNIAQGYNVSVFSTFEYKKIETGHRPTNNDLREAVNIEYDINYLEHLFSPLKAARDTGREEQESLWHGHPYNKKPILEGTVGKNKITDLTPTHFYKFYPDQSRCEALTADEIMAIRDGNKIEEARKEPDRKITWDKGRMIKIPPKEEPLLFEEPPF